MGSHRVRHDWSNLACMHALEKEMATHSSVLAWRIPGTEELGGLLSMGSHRVRHSWSDLAAAVLLSGTIILENLSQSGFHRSDSIGIVEPTSPSPLFSLKFWLDLDESPGFIVLLTALHGWWGPSEYSFLILSSCLFLSYPSLITLPRPPISKRVTKWW